MTYPDGDRGPAAEIIIVGGTFANGIESGIRNDGAVMDIRDLTIVGSPKGVQLLGGGILRMQGCTFDPNGYLWLPL